MSPISEKVPFELRSKESQERVVKAIEEAELNTSGEIRVHVESVCEGDPVKRAVEAFDNLKMGETALKNGVLIYIAHDSHKVAIIGDTGINEKVGPDYWKEILDGLKKDFASSNVTAGLCQAIINVGKQLKVLFPYQGNDINEQSNEVSFDK